MAAVDQGVTNPYIVHWYTNNGVFKKLSVPLVSFPVLASSINSGNHPLSLEFSTNDQSAQAPVQGDLCSLTEDGGDGTVVYKGFAQNPVTQIAGDQLSIKFDLSPMVQELGETPFNRYYTVATDTGQIMRDAVNTTKHFTATTTEIPNTGVTAIIDFPNSNCLRAVEEAKRLTGPFMWWFADGAAGKVFGEVANVGGVADYTVKLSQEITAQTSESPFDSLLNWIPIIGGTNPADTNHLLVSVYDNGFILHAPTGGGIPNPLHAPSSTYGVKGLTQPLTYPNVTDQITLDNLATTLGQQFNRLTKSYHLEIVNYPQRIAIGKVLRTWEPSSWGEVEGYVGAGGYSPNLVVLDVEVEGPTQRITAADMPVSIQDFQVILDRMAGNAAGTAASAPTAILPITPPNTSPGTLPALVAGVATSSAVQNVAQVDNASITISWTANGSGDVVDHYEIRYKKSGDATYTYHTTAALAYKITGLVPGVSYLLMVQAINVLGGASGYGADVTQAAASDSTAPAVPTGLVAIKTPRGALVSWNGNTEADLAGYQVQVSVAGGAFTLVTPGVQLGTMLAYVAPSGTALGTALLFQVRASDWSGNLSAWSASSASVATDGVVFDELLVGNLKVFGTLTTGGLQTAASGARAQVSSAGFTVYDATATDYGGGAGVVFKADNAGNVFIKGVVSASAFVGSGTAPAYTLPATGFAIDPTNGFRWYNAGTLVAQWAANGALTIYSAGSIYAATIATSQALATITNNVGYRLTGTELDFVNAVGATAAGLVWYSFNNSTSTQTKIGGFFANYGVGVPLSTDHSAEVQIWAAQNLRLMPGQDTGDFAAGTGSVWVDGKFAIGNGASSDSAAFQIIGSGQPGPVTIAGAPMIRMGNNAAGGNPTIVLDSGTGTAFCIDNNGGASFRIFKSGTELFTVNAAGTAFLGGRPVVSMGTSSPTSVAPRLNTYSVGGLAVAVYDTTVESIAAGGFWGTPSAAGSTATIGYENPSATVFRVRYGINFSVIWVGELITS